MSEGTFCRVEVHYKSGCKGVFVTRTCFRDVMLNSTEHENLCAHKLKNSHIQKDFHA